jgi:hypothetical protein
MRTSRLGLAAALIGGITLVGVGIALNLLDDDDAGPSTRSAERRGETRAGGGGEKRLPFARASISPEAVDLGKLTPCAPRGRFEVAVANDGDTPIRIEGWLSTSSCLVPEVEPGFTVAAGAVEKVPIRVEPWDPGRQSHRIEFRVAADGHAVNAVGASVRVDFTMETPILVWPSVPRRPERGDRFIVDFERCNPDGSFLEEAFDIFGVEPKVGQIQPPLGDGHGAVIIDFAAIDELAAQPEAQENRDFEWMNTPNGRRWRSLDVVVRTSLESCPELRVRVRNR